MEQHTPLPVTQHHHGQGQERDCGYRGYCVQKPESATESDSGVVIYQKLISLFIFII